MSASSKDVRSRVRKRRLLVLAGTLLFFGLGAGPMDLRLAQSGLTLLKVFLLGLFDVLLLQVAFGFTVAMAGWWQLRRGGDPVRIHRTLPPEAAPEVGPKTLPATAVVVPIFNEDVDRVFQGLRIMYESLQATGRGDAFDFFILSDSSDLNLWIAEEKAWFELCKRVQGFGRIFYRKRRITPHHKSGNIADFCRRWGTRYRYMIVLDADSVVTGAAMVRLASLMEENPTVGIIQTSPQLVLGQSLFQRVNQFATCVYGPEFAAGLNFWQLDNANFWGHNAIIRLRPFMKHCAMPELPGIGPLGTRILSHDTIESAFMRRAGWGVWLAYDLEGSYEESPPHLLASLQRDRRWCHGNLQHTWVLFTRGLTPVSRVNILNGVMAYLGSPLWLLFVLLSPFLLVQNGDVTSMTGAGLWLLYAYVLGLLLLPKALATTLLFRSPEKCRACGGAGKIVAGVLAETVYSTIMAPILMLFNTRFVWASFTGAVVRWGRQKRSDDTGPTWGELLSAHLSHTFFTVAWAATVAWLAPAYLPWLVPILVGPIVAVPFSRFTGSNSVGARARAGGWFVIPEETRPPAELQKIGDPFMTPARAFFQSREYAMNYGLLQAVLDPYVNAIHVSLLRQRPQVAIRTHEYMVALADRLLLEGPFVLTPQEKRTLLWDADSMSAIHEKLWDSPASHLHEWWRAAFRHYNESSALTLRRTVSAL